MIVYWFVNIIIPQDIIYISKNAQKINIKLITKVGIKACNKVHELVYLVVFLIFYFTLVLSNDVKG